MDPNWIGPLATAFDLLAEVDQDRARIEQTLLALAWPAQMREIAPLLHSADHDLP